MHYQRLLAVTLLVLLVSAASALAIGQTAGHLNFEVPRGGEQTLSYTLINNEETPLTVTVEIEGNLSEVTEIGFETATLPAASSLKIEVTAKAKRNAIVGTTYSGLIRATAVVAESESPGVGATLQLAAAKPATLTITESVSSSGNLSLFSSSYFPLVIVAILIILGFAYYVRKKL